MFQLGSSRGRRCCLVVVPSPLISRLRSSHAEDQAVFPVAWEADGRGSQRSCSPCHPAGVGLAAGCSVAPSRHEVPRFWLALQAFGVEEWEGCVSKVGLI